MAGGGGTTPPITPSARPGRRHSTASGRPARTASCAPSGEDVGLPGGQMGNSEVGHLNIGAGRVVMQDLPRIGPRHRQRRDRPRAPALLGLIQKLKAKPRNMSPHRPGFTGRCALASRSCRRARPAPQRMPAYRVLVHALTDGRDTPPQSAAEDIKRLARGAAQIGVDRDSLRPLLCDGPR